MKFLCIFALAVVFLGQGARAQQFVPNVAALRTCNSTTCCNNVACSTSNYIELGGYFASADGGQGIFQWYLGSAFCQNSFPSGKTTAGSNQIKNLSSTTGVQAGDAISDGSGAIPAGTYITAVSASALTMTISQNATTTNFGDTFTVDPDNGGTVIQASGTGGDGSCWQRLNFNGNVLQFGAKGDYYPAYATQTDNTAPFNATKAAAAAAGFNTITVGSNATGSRYYLPYGFTVDPGMSLVCPSGPLGQAENP